MTLPVPDPALSAAWRATVARYQTPDLRRSLWMLANSVLPFFALWALMAWSLRYSYWLTLALAVPAAGFLMRIFIIFHDCGHGSYFKSPRLNTWVGRFTGLLTFTPFYAWTRDHAIHHASAGDLDRRGIGDVMTLTAREYLALPWPRRLAYRIMRFPVFTFIVGGPLVFVLGHRIPRKGSGWREQRSVWSTNLALAAVLGGLGWLVGFKTLLLVQAPITCLGTALGVWLFYVQHNYPGVYWARHSEWNYLASAIYGASYYQLPGLLQWFSGNIGFHHLHHLSPKIPNYRLARCQAENPVFGGVRPLSLRGSLACLGLRLYDEENRRMIGFGELKQR